ncbi:MAG: hypothetical protein IPN76_13970 [Saprospiraceae bacterium]|nr:hypothetical protein [Saprospiraceae bacterium]
MKLLLIQPFFPTQLPVHEALRFEAAMFASKIEISNRFGLGTAKTGPLAGQVAGVRAFQLQVC